LCFDSGTKDLTSLSLEKNNELPICVEAHPTLQGHAEIDDDAQGNVLDNIFQHLYVTQIPNICIYHSHLPITIFWRSVLCEEPKRA
jgi:hypothetical protein